MNKGKINHKCVICGAGYHACDDCLSVKSYTPWRAIADTQEHYLIYITIRSYQEKIISKEAARVDLIKQGVKEGKFDCYLPSVAEILNDIFTPDKAAGTKKKSYAAPIIEEDIDDVDIDDVEDDIENE